MHARHQVVRGSPETLVCEHKVIAEGWPASPVLPCRAIGIAA